MEADFSPDRKLLLDRGWIVAFAHVRGGMEKGKSWYLTGRKEAKMNSFLDFLACADHLVSVLGITSPRHLAAQGTSAGGLLVAASANLRPDIFRAISLEVPFVDVLSAMSDPTLPLTSFEYDEWGNPCEESDRLGIESWDPYRNIPPPAKGGSIAGGGDSFPSVYITMAMNDNRVPFWAPLKYAARLRSSIDWGEGRDKSKSVYPRHLLLRVDHEHGHYGEGGRFASLDGLSEELAFLVNEIEG